MVFDNNGIRAPGAKAYFYEAGTSTPKAVYADGDESTVRTNPVIADGNGRWEAVFVPYGNYKYRITTSGGAAIGDTIDDIPNPAPVDEDFSVDELQLLTTGDVIFTFKDGERAGFVRCNGRTIGSASSGAIERANADCEPLFAFLWNNFANSICAVSAGRGANAAADWGANKTITLHDARGALLGGLADMGSSDAGHYNPTYIPVVTGDATTGGSTLGSNTHLLHFTELPVHGHPVNIVTGASGSDHTHGISLTTVSDGAHTHTVSGTAASDGAHSHTINITDPGHTHTNGVTDPGHIHTTGTGGNSGLVANTGSIGSGGGSQYVNNGTLSTNSNTTGISVSTNSNTTGVTASSVSGGAHTHSVSGTAASNGAHTHGVSGTSAGISADHVHAVSGNTGGAGSGAFHNNLPRTVIGTVLMKL